MSNAVSAKTRLVELETVIERGLATFVEVGEALIEVRGSRLYRFDYGTFEDYCRERWGFSRVQAHRLMEASEVARVLPMGNNVPNERQARELAPILRRDGPEAVRDTWTEVIERSEGRPTARVVREVVAEIIEPEEPPAPIRKPVASSRITLTEVRGYARSVENILAMLQPSEVVPAANPVLRELARTLVSWAQKWPAEVEPEEGSEVGEL